MNNELLEKLRQPFPPEYITEEWRPVSGYESRHEISNVGRLRTFYISNSKRTREEPLYRKGWVNRSGYMIYSLHLNGHKTNQQAHRLVACAFLGKSNLDVNHIDGDKLNNYVDNLEYCTRAENIYHSHYTLGKQMGESHPHAKLSNNQIDEIRSLLAMGLSQRAIAEQFGVVPSYISMINSGHARKEESQ